MKKQILAHLDFYMPSYCAGSETYVHTLLKYLQKSGHGVTVLTKSTMGVDGYVYEGITVRTDDTFTDQLYTEADYVITQIGYSDKVNKLCKRKGKKLIYLIHNNQSATFWNVKAEDVHLAVFNAAWIRNYHHDHMKWFAKNELTLYPPVMFDKFSFPQYEDVEKKFITLVNLCNNKGVLTFIQAAKMMPQFEFLGVVGAYAEQFSTGLPKNITVIPHTPNMVQDVYRKTKLILMPSLKETWGMVAIEGMCSGIPCIAHPAAGLVEACGPAGVFANRSKAFVWEELIKKFMINPTAYRKQSNMCVARAKELSSLAEIQLLELERFISNDETM